MADSFPARGQSLQPSATVFLPDSLATRRINQLQGLIKSGDYQKIIKRSRALLQQIHPESDKLPAAYNLLAIGMMHKGAHKDAIAVIQKGIQLLKEEQTFDRMKLIYNLSACLDAVGESIKSLEALEEARVLATTAEGIPRKEAWMIYNGLAIWHQKYGNEQDALTWAKASLAIMPEDPNFYDKAYTYRIIGFIHYYHYRNETALAYFQKARDIIWTHYPQGNLELAAVLELIGRTQHDLGRRDVRDQSFRQAEQMLLRLGREQVLLSKLYVAIGWYFQQDKEPIKALQAYQRGLCSVVPSYSDSLTFFTNPDIKESYHAATLLQLLLVKGETLEKFFGHNTDSLELAFETFCLAADLIEQLRQEIESEVSNQMLSRQVQPVFENILRSSYALESRAPSSERLARSFQYIEKSRSYLLARSMFKSESGEAYGLPDSLLQKERGLRSDLNLCRRQLVQLASLPDSSKRRELAATIDSIGTAYQVVLDQIQTTSPGFYSFHFPGKKVDLRQLQLEALRPGELMVHCFAGKKHWYAFQIEQDQLCLVQEEIREDSLAQLVNNFAELLTIQSYIQRPDRQAVAAYSQCAFQVYQACFRQIDLTRAKKRVIIIPDGPLCQIPIDILLDDTVSEYSSFKDLPYLIHKYAIQYANSADLWYKQRKTRMGRAPDKMLALAIGGSQEKTLRLRNDFSEDLPGTTEEIKSISRHFSGRFLSGAEASKQTFLTDADKCRLLHLATHAKTDPSNPLQSYFVVGTSKDGKTSEKLFAHELSSLSLKADLAVLSACETGLGPYAITEGNMSLGRSFMQAGCAALVFSMWEIEDNSSAQLMDAFYENLQAQTAKDEALRLAKLRSLQLADELTAHPYFWGAFISSGNPDPIYQSEADSNWILVLVLLPLIIVMVFWGKKMQKKV
ncbi:MAG: CHAT domain-containing protein [Bacteroidota bacterium]